MLNVRVNLRKVAAVAASLAVVMFSSCEKDKEDDETETPEEALIGAELISWSSEYVVYEEYWRYYENTYNVKLHYENLTKDTVLLLSTTVLRLEIDQEMVHRVFSDKSTIESTITEMMLQSGENQSTEWEYLYCSNKEYYSDIPQLPLGLFAITWVEAYSIIWGSADNERLNLPHFEPKFIHKENKYGTTTEQAIEGKVYTVTPVEVHFDYTFGNDYKQTAFIRVELYVEK